MPIDAETCFSMLIGFLGIISNIGILSITRLIGRVPRQKISSGGYSTDETASEVRNIRVSVDRRGHSDNKMPKLFSSSLEVKHLSLLSPCSKASLLRLSSLLSINKLGPDEQATKDRKISSGHRISSRWKSRRHQKYLQGLITVAFCNVFLSVMLLLKTAGLFWSNSQERVFHGQEDYPPWQRASISLGLMIVLDVFQAAEIGAIMWIAINRAGAIHNTSRRNASKYGPGAQSYSDRRPSCCPVQGLTCCSGQRRPDRSSQVNMIMSNRHDQSRHDGNLNCCPPTRKASRTFSCMVCLLPVGIIILATVLSLTDWTTIIEPGNIVQWFYPNTSIWSPLAYYTPSVSIGVGFGHFLLPVAFLVTTNILIYRKVSLRHKRFCSRRSSHNGKTNCMCDDEESCSAVLDPSPHHSPDIKPLSIPTLMVTGSSQTDVHRGSLQNLQTSPSVRPLRPHSCSPARKFASIVPPVFLQTCPQLQTAASTVDMSSFEAVELAQPHTRASIILPVSHSRRSSLIDAVAASRHQRAASAPLGDSPLHTTDVQFLDLLRRQHKRTVVVLVIILCVYLACHGPRFLALCLHVHWGAGRRRLPTVGLHLPQRARAPDTTVLLTYATLWSRLCTLIDPIIYGFWGNRAYRQCLRSLSRRMLMRR